jgi:hypothetical protein
VTEHPEFTAYQAAAADLTKAGEDAPVFSKDALILLATQGETMGVRRAAADALYELGRIDGARKVQEAIRG